MDATHADPWQPGVRRETATRRRGGERGRTLLVHGVDHGVGQNVAPALRGRGRQPDDGIAPARFGIERGDQARHGHHHALAAAAARKGAEMIFARAKDLQRLVGAFGEEIGMGSAQREDPRNQRELHRPVLPPVEQPGNGGRRQCLLLGHQPPALAIIDRPAIVGVHQAEIPELGALIDVGTPGKASLSRVCARLLSTPSRAIGRRRPGSVQEQVGAGWRRGSREETT